MDDDDDDDDDDDEVDLILKIRCGCFVHVVRNVFSICLLLV